MAQTNIWKILFTVNLILTIAFDFNLTVQASGALPQRLAFP